MKNTKKAPGRIEFRKTYPSMNNANPIKFEGVFLACPASSIRSYFLIFQPFSQGGVNA